MVTNKQYFKERNRSLCKRCYDILVFLKCKRSADILCKRCIDIYQLIFNTQIINIFQIFNPNPQGCAFLIYTGGFKPALGAIL